MLTESLHTSLAPAETCIAHDTFLEFTLPKMLTLEWGGVAGEGVNVEGFSRSLTQEGEQWTITDKYIAGHEVKTHIGKLDRGEGWTITQELVNPTDNEYKLSALVPLKVTFGGEDVWVGTPGYQSWSAGLTQVPLESPYLLAPSPIKNFRNAKAQNHLVSAEMAQISIDGEQAILAGFTRSQRQHGSIEVERINGCVEVTALAWLEGKTMAAGESVMSEELVLLTQGSEREQRLLYGKLAAEANDITKPIRPKPYWCSWYDWFQKIKPEHVKENLPHLIQIKERVRGMEELMVILDDTDYWGELPGDDKTKEYIDEVRLLAEEIKEAGLVPGLWQAPAVVNEKSRIYLQHPEWLVTDEKGNPVMVKAGVWNGNNYALDITHPEAQKWYRKMLGRIKATGMEAYKLDFLYAAAVAGKRYGDLTSAEAYSLFMQITREELGEEAYIVGCGAPLLASAGWVDCMRITTDTLEEWDLPFLNGDGTQASMDIVFQSLEERVDWTASLYVNDLDALIFRDHHYYLKGDGRSPVEGGKFSDDEIKIWTIKYLLSSQRADTVIGLGDYLPWLEKERWEIISKMFPLSTVRALAEGEMYRGLSNMMQMELLNGGMIVGLFNWTDKSEHRCVDLTQWGMEGAFHVVDNWDFSYRGITRDRWEQFVPGRGAELLTLVPVTDEPQVLGVSSHFLGIGSEIDSMEWNAKKLTVRFFNRQDTRKILLFVPSHYRMLQEGKDLGRGIVNLEATDQELTLEFEQMAF